jgi:hypothetical protein
MDTITRFESKVLRTEGCWLWTAGIKHHYGQFRVGIRQCLAHRVAWELYCGSIPEGMCVLHNCDNQLCVNPNHLFLGTQLDNIRDRNNKGRTAHRLTEEQVLEIRTLYSGGDYNRRR